MKLLTVKVEKCNHSETLEPIHRLWFMIAPDKAIKNIGENIEVPMAEVQEHFIVFKVGQDLKDMVLGLRSLADHLEAQ